MKAAAPGGNLSVSSVGGMVLPFGRGPEGGDGDMKVREMLSGFRTGREGISGRDA